MNNVSASDHDRKQQPDQRCAYHHVVAGFTAGRLSPGHLNDPIHKDSRGSERQCGNQETRTERQRCDDAHPDGAHAEKGVPRLIGPGLVSVRYVISERVVPQRPEPIGQHDSQTVLRGKIREGYDERPREAEYQGYQCICSQNSLPSPVGRQQA